MRRLLGLAGAACFLFSVSAVPAAAAPYGPPYQLAFEFSTMGIAGGPLYGPTVSVKDAAGWTVMNDNSTVVTIALVPGTGHPKGALTCAGGFSRPATGGWAVFEGCSISKPARDYVLEATAPGLVPARSEPFNVDAPGAEQSAGTDSYQDAYAAWGTLINPDPAGLVYNPRFVLQVMEDSGNYSYVANGVRHYARFEYGYDYCDSATDTWVNVGISTPFGVATHSQGVFRMSKKGASFVGDLTVQRTTWRRAHCDNPSADFTGTIEMLEIHVVVEWQVTGDWERSVWCERYAPPPTDPDAPSILARGSGWETVNAEARLTVTGDLDISLDPDSLYDVHLRQGSSVAGLPDKGQPWECRDA